MEGLVIVKIFEILDIPHVILCKLLSDKYYKFGDFLEMSNKLLMNRLFKTPKIILEDSWDFGIKKSKIIIISNFILIIKYVKSLQATFKGTIRIEKLIWSLVVNFIVYLDLINMHDLIPIQYYQIT